MSFLKSVATFGGYTMVSRVLGVIRDILTAAILGAGPIADAFFVALKLPNFFRRLSAEGAFSAAFVPIFNQELVQTGKKQAITFARETLSVMVAILVGFSVIAMIFMPNIIGLIAPGFHPGEARYDLAIDLTRITFPYLTCMSMVALFGGVLNSFNRFMPFAAAPIFLNLSLIFMLTIGIMFSQTAGHAMAYGVLLAGFIQVLWMIYFTREHGLTLQIPKPRLTPEIKKMFKLMLPGVLAAGITQINLFVDILLGSLLPAGSISYLFYGDRLHQLPLGVIGAAIGTALLPALSAKISSGKQKEAKTLMGQALKLGVLISMPATIGLAILAEPIYHVLFERGSFTASDRIQTALALQAYAFGLVGYIIAKVFVNSYFASQDTKTPVKCSLIAMTTNIILSLILINIFAHVGIAAATSIAAWVQVILLFRYLKEKTNLTLDHTIKKDLMKIFFGGIVMGFVVWGGLHLINPIDMPNLMLKILSLFGLITLGAICYGGIMLATKTVAIADLKRLRKRA